MKKSGIEEVKFYSYSLGKEMAMLVYLPEGYENLAPLPVLYFLHGRSGNENIMYGAELNTTADKMIEAGEINPMIIVCPRIENSRGLNSSLVNKEVPDAEVSNLMVNLGMYEDYFINEVIPFVDGNFNTINKRNSRFIGGASGGGYTALHNALRHQDLFTKAGGHMPAMELKLEEEDKPFYTDISLWEKYDPISIARNNHIAPDIEFYLDAGDKDEGGFYKGCAVLQKILEDKGIKSQNHVFEGHHSVEYIKSNMEKYLKFYGERAYPAS